MRHRWPWAMKGTFPVKHGVKGFDLLSIRRSSLTASHKTTRCGIGSKWNMWPQHPHEWAWGRQNIHWHEQKVKNSWMVARLKPQSTNPSIRNSFFGERICFQERRNRFMNRFGSRFNVGFSSTPFTKLSHVSKKVQFVTRFLFCPYSATRSRVGRIRSVTQQISGLVHEQRSLDTETTHRHSAPSFVAPTTRVPMKISFFDSTAGALLSPQHSKMTLLLQQPKMT